MFLKITVNVEKKVEIVIFYCHTGKKKKCVALIYLLIKQFLTRVVVHKSLALHSSKLKYLGVGELAQ